MKAFLSQKGGWFLTIYIVCFRVQNVTMPPRSLMSNALEAFTADKSVKFLLLVMTER